MFGAEVNVRVEMKEEGTKVDYVMTQSDGRCYTGPRAMI
jgi:hypothetical protein